MQRYNISDYQYSKFCVFRRLKILFYIKENSFYHLSTSFYHLYRYSLFFFRQYLPYILLIKDGAQGFQDALCTALCFLFHNSMFSAPQLYVFLLSKLWLVIINQLTIWKLLKIGPYHNPKFGGIKKKSYFCRWLGERHQPLLHTINRKI